MAQEKLLTSEHALHLETLLEIIVDADGSWREKKEQLHNELTQDAINNLEEIAGWFEGD
jgi:hypothetical protein